MAAGAPHQFAVYLLRLQFAPREFVQTCTARHSASMEGVKVKYHAAGEGVGPVLGA